MRIGELSERTGTSRRLLRYYEEQGLIVSERCANGYRDYDESELRMVAEIRGLLATGFGLHDIRPFVDCLRAGNSSGDVCPDSRAVLRRKLAEVDACIEQLVGVRHKLQAQLEEQKRALEAQKKAAAEAKRLLEASTEAAKSAQRALDSQKQAEEAVRKSEAELRAAAKIPFLFGH